MVTMTATTDPLGHGLGHDDPSEANSNSPSVHTNNSTVSPALLPSATISAQTLQETETEPEPQAHTATDPANENAPITIPAHEHSDLSWLGPLIDDGSDSDLLPGPDSESGPSPEIILAAQALRHTPTSRNNHRNNTASPTTSTLLVNNHNNPDAISKQSLLDNILDANEVAVKKLSPGLAARLKALGLGALKKSSLHSSSGNDRVGRLAEEQIRQIDDFWTEQQRIERLERRGRPWKGVVRIPSRSSLKSAKSNKDAVTPEDVDVPTIRIVESPEPHNSSSADRIQHDYEASEALDMDTNKYRLPDHSNGNGTKNTPDMRRDHLERDPGHPPSPPDDAPPPPVPAKDTPPLPSQSQTFNPDDYFNPLGLQRPGSIYTLSRASFAAQLAQLTSLQLPDAESLAAKVAAIPSAQAAVKALIGAAEQIRSWISKAAEVIAGLDSDDDVEWSAAGGREGLEEVESATARFEGLIDVYVTAIEALQERQDIPNVTTEDLTKAVTQMEAIMDEWTNIRVTLRSVRGQVEIAMEWEELWNVVLGEIQSELDELSRLVFEMEERRHKSAIAIASGDAVDIGDLQTIVEETPPTVTRARATNRYGLPLSPGSPTSGGQAISADDSSLLALFARMQPLRASLDFLPMRLSTFEARSQKIFPTACDELEMRQKGLEATYKKLEKDAEGLRRELGEDRWVLVFRGAARQAQKMTESVDRSVEKVREAVEAGMHLTNQPAFMKKIESYDAKKTHYGPAIDRVLLIIDRGVKERLTVNGEILRLSADLQAKWADLKTQIKEMDQVLDAVQTDKRGSHLRDSISSMLSNDMASTVASGLETPQSSPPSSVIMGSLGIETRTPGSKSGSATRVRRSSSGVSSHLPQLGRRTVSATTPNNSISRKPVSRLATYGGHSTPARETSGRATPNANRHAASIPRPSTTMAHRPRWNGSTVTSDLDTGFKPLSLSTPSPYAKRQAMTTPVRSHSSLAAPLGSKLPMRGSLRAASPSPSPQTPPRPVSKLNLMQGPPLSRGRNAFLQPSSKSNDLGMAPRPASSMATTNRRQSMLPVPKFMRERSQTGTGRASPVPSSSAMPRFTRETSLPASTGRASPMPLAKSRIGLRPRGMSVTSNDRKEMEKPRWHG